MNLRTLACTLAAASAAGLAPLPAQAKVITFQYTAVGQAGTGSAGASVTGTFGWDTSVPDTNPQGFARYNGAGFMTAQVSGGAQDGTSIQASGIDVEIADAQSVWTNDVVNFLGSGQFVYLSGASSALNSEALPLTLDPAQWLTPDPTDFAHGHLSVVNGSQWYYDIQSFRLLDDDAPASVPEPGTAALVGLAGLLALVASRRPARRRVNNLSRHHS